MDNIGKMTLAGMMEYTLFLGLLCLVFACGIYYFRSKLENRNAKLFSKELNYDIYYDGTCITRGFFRLKQGERKRFGFSKEDRYHNDIIIEEYLHEIEDFSVEDEKKIKELYGTWFEVRMFDGAFSVSAAYTSRERYNGNKPIYLKNRTLKHDGENVENEMHIYSSARDKRGFRIDLYDESKMV